MDRVQRLLVQVLRDPPRGGESLLGSIKIAVLPIAKVFTMCFLGFLMATKYVNILPYNGRKLLNGLVFSLLLPRLIFSQLGQAITFQKLIEWWFIPVNVVLATIAGSIVGNIGNVPLVLIAALCQDKSNPFGDSDKCSRDGNAYISFGQWVGAIVVYTYVFHMLAPPPGGTFDVEDANLPVKNPTRISSSIPARDSSPEHVPLLTEEAISNDSSSTKKDKVQQFLKFIYDKLKLKQIFQPPIIASVFAIFIGCVPSLKKLILTSDAPFYFFTDSCMILGEAMIPCILLALGGNLVDVQNLVCELLLL